MRQKDLGLDSPEQKTLGFGADKCTHRFVKNMTPIKAWPPYDLEEFNEDYWLR